MAGKKTVRIDALPESAWRYAGYEAIVCVDVLLSATTIVTAVGQRRRVRLVPDARAAAAFRDARESPLLLTDRLTAADDQGIRFGGPTQLQKDDGGQMLVHVSPFAAMVAAASLRGQTYVACLRNLEATANELSLRHRRVVVIGAGEDGEVCAADQMAAAWLALRLQGRDFELEGRNTHDEARRWASSDASLVGLSRSAERLRSRGRASDVEFVLGHINDLEAVAAYDEGEVHDPVLRRRRLAEETPTPAWGTPRLGEP
jgi:phosphosulfolactate phosphohydrolase-like enzyme